MEFGYLGFSKNIKVSADRLIAFLDIKNILSNYGKVYFTGSYNTDLMTNYDLDIDVVSASKRESAIDFFNKMVETKKIQKIQFGDFENHKRENRPQDYIVVLIVVFENVKWEVEIWFKSEMDKKKEEIETRLKNLDENVRIKILDDKISRDKNSNKNILSSFDIYQKYL